MSSFITLLKRAWDALFYTRQSFWNMIFFSIAPAILASLWGWVVLGATFLGEYFGISMSSIWIPLQVVLVVLWIIVLIWFIFLSLVCGYISMRILANNFQKKKESMRILISHWRETGDYFGTLLASIFYTLWWLLLGSTLISLGLLTGLLNNILYNILLVPAGILFIVLIVFITLPLVMVNGVFFFEKTVWFKAIKESRMLVKWRWWRTLGLLLLLIITCLVVVLLVWIWEQWASFLISAIVPQGMSQQGPVSYLFFGTSIVWGFLQIVLQTLLKFYSSSYIFALYEDYKKHPVK